MCIRDRSQVEQMIAEGELAAQEEEDIVADDGFDLDAAVDMEDFDLPGEDDLGGDA